MCCCGRVAVGSGAVAEYFLLEEFGLDHGGDGMVYFARDFAVVDFVEEEHDLGEEIVADEYGDVVAPSCVDGGLSPSAGVAVDDVIVEEGCVVEHFDAYGEQKGALRKGRGLVL